MPVGKESILRAANAGTRSAKTSKRTAAPKNVKQPVEEKKTAANSPVGLKEELPIYLL